MSSRSNQKSISMEMKKAPGDGIFLKPGDNTWILFQELYLQSCQARFGEAAEELINNEETEFEFEAPNIEPHTAEWEIFKEDLRAIRAKERTVYSSFLTYRDPDSRSREHAEFHQFQQEILL